MRKRSNTRAAHNWSDTKYQLFLAALLSHDSTFPSLPPAVFAPDTKSNPVHGEQVLTRAQRIHSCVFPQLCVSTLHCNPTCNTTVRRKHTPIQCKTLSGERKRPAIDKPGETYLVSILLMYCQFLGVSFNHLSVLSLMKHQPKL